MLRLAALLAAVSSLALAAPAAASHTAIDLISGGGDEHQDARYRWASPDGQAVIFETSEPLLAADTDVALDLYLRRGEATMLLTPGTPDADVQFEGASTDASVVVFTTTESLDAADSDTVADAYERRNGSITLLSDDDDPAEPDQAQPVAVSELSDDGERVFLTTKAKLLANDTDLAKSDIYLRHAGTTTRVSSGPQNDNGSQHHMLTGITPDGTHAYFQTSQQLLPGDADYGHVVDVYEWSAGELRLISDRESGADALDTHATFVDAADDGSRVAFYTTEQLTGDDTDEVYDIFVRDGATIRKVSEGNGPYGADFNDATADLSQILYTTEEAVTAGDGDAFFDVYRASTGAAPQTELVSRRTADGPGATADHVSYEGASDDLATVFFSSTEAMAPEDEDAGLGEDVFVRSGGTTRLVTPTLADEENASVDVMSTAADGGSLVMETDRRLLDSDTDDFYDVYEWRDGTTRHVADGEGGETTFQSATPDHRALLVWSLDALVAADADAAWDVYAVRTLPHEHPRPQQQEQPQQEVRQDATPVQHGSDGPAREQAPVRDTTAPVAILGGAKGQRVVRTRGLRVTVRADEAATAVLRARVKLGGRTIAARGVTRAVAAGRTATATLRLATADLRKLKRALRPGRTAAATITLTVTDAAGNAAMRTLALRVRS